MASHERATQRTQLEALVSREEDRRPERHEDRRVPRRGQPKEATKRVERPIGVTGAGPEALGLRSVHDGPEPADVEAEHLARRLDDDPHLVVILTAGEPSAVRGRTDFDEQDRSLGERRDLEHACGQSPSDQGPTPPTLSTAIRST